MFRLIQGFNMLGRKFIVSLLVYTSGTLAFSSIVYAYGRWEMNDPEGAIAMALIVGAAGCIGATVGLWFDFGRSRTPDR